MGVLQLNVEFGILCTRGIKSVYGSNTVVETYDVNNGDLRTPITKLLGAQVDAVFHASFEAQTVNALKILRAFGSSLLTVGLTETMTDDATAELTSILEGDVFFGLPSVGASLRTQIMRANSGVPIANENAAALAYVHMISLGEALHHCGGEIICVAERMNVAPAVSEVGFEGFVDRKALFKTQIVEWRDGKLVSVRLR